MICFNIFIIFVLNTLLFLSVCSENENESISSKKCHEIYLAIEKNNTGFTKPKLDHGEPADLNEFPYIAAIGWTKEDGSGVDYKCGGVLISPNYVAAEAHCVIIAKNKPKADVVLLGSISPDPLKNSKSNIPIKRIVTHPHYAKCLRYEDIALIELEHNAQNRPACLLSDFEIHETDGTLIFYHHDAATKKNKLQKVEAKIHSNEKCVHAYKPTSRVNRRLYKGFVDSQLCVEEILTDKCENIFRGPLLIERTEAGKAIPYVVALSSFGLECENKIVPSIYSKLSVHSDWIESVIWQKE